MTVIADPEVNVLAGLATALQAEYTEEGLAWHGSPFAWIKTRPSRQIGTIGERLIAGYFATKGFNVSRAPNSDADRLIEGLLVEVKFSTIWKGGFYKFQQLRDQNYQVAICLGVSPFDAHCWVIPKSTILERWRLRDGIESQHGGVAGSDTAWLTVFPSRIPSWLNSTGGTLSMAIEAFTGLSGFRPTDELTDSTGG